MIQVIVSCNHSVSKAAEKKGVMVIFLFITREDKCDLARFVFVEPCPAHSLTFGEEVQQLTEKLQRTEHKHRKK